MAKRRKGIRTGLIVAGVAVVGLAAYAWSRRGGGAISMIGEFYTQRGAPGVGAIYATAAPSIKQASMWVKFKATITNNSNAPVDLRLHLKGFTGSTPLKSGAGGTLEATPIDFTVDINYPELQQVNNVRTIEIQQLVSESDAAGSVNAEAWITDRNNVMIGDKRASGILGTVEALTTAPTLTGGFTLN